MRMRLTLFFLAAAGMLPAVPVHAEAATVEVQPGQSIQAAVDIAAPGDTIIVKAGTYKESVVVTKSGLTIQGQGAVLGAPAVVQPPGPCSGLENPAAVSGFCVSGVVDFETFAVTTYIEDVTISGFQVSGFTGSGIIAYGAKNATFEANRAVDNGEHGIAAFFSTGTKVLSNWTARSAEAGIYIGDSPEARALVDGNASTDNLIGVFVRGAVRGTIRNNRVAGNCVGVLFLADAPSPTGRMTVANNTISKNSKRPSGPSGRHAPCAANEQQQLPPLSGVGVALLGANGVTIKKNAILGNKPGGPTAYRGGVVVRRGDQGTAPKNNQVTGNQIQYNKPDLSWDKSGWGNAFRNNRCDTSRPRNLC